MKMKKIAIISAMCALLLIPAVAAFSHCEIPCGIYNDAMRITMIQEHIATIEKSMITIQSLEKEKDHNANQLIRWVMNKDDHATQLQEIVAQYFMTQRITPDTKKYSKKLEILQQMLIYSMKCKQTTDLSHVEKLKSLVADFEKLYFEK
jgi:nickel superoxide dismutase